MLTEWLIAIALVALAGLVVLTIVRVVNYLDQTTLISEGLGAEPRPPYEDQRR